MSKNNALDTLLSLAVEASEEAAKVLAQIGRASCRERV